jgi:hypothetical protein
MRTTDTLILGGGQAGLALSRCLTARGRDHLVIERGRIAERWRSERWDSLHLLTPNWMTRLPGWSYEGPDPDGFMAATAPRWIAGGSFDAPVHEHTEVHHVGFDGTVSSPPAKGRSARSGGRPGWGPAVPSPPAPGRGHRWSDVYRPATWTTGVLRSVHRPPACARRRAPAAGRQVTLAVGRQPVAPHLPRHGHSGGST